MYLQHLQRDSNLLMLNINPVPCSDVVHPNSNSTDIVVTQYWSSGVILRDCYARSTPGFRAKKPLSASVHATVHGWVPRSLIKSIAC